MEAILKKKVLIVLVIILSAAFSLFLYYFFSKNNIKNEKLEVVENSGNQFLRTYFARGFLKELKDKTFTIESERLGNKNETRALVFELDSESKIECWPEYTTDQHGNKIFYKNVFLDASSSMKKPLVKKRFFKRLSKKI